MSSQKRSVKIMSGSWPRRRARHAASPVAALTATGIITP